MKRKIYIFVVLIMTSLGSCQKLDITPDSSLTNISYWRTEADAKSALNGLYNRYRTAFTTHNWLYWYECRSGNIAPGLQPGGIEAFINNNITSSLNDANWQPFYTVISMANGIIQNVGNIPFKDADQKNEIIAQAYFFRAWSYFNLVRLWGKVPLVTEFIDSGDHPQLYPIRSEISAVFALIKDDLHLAENLYMVNKAVDKSRVSRAAILMLKTDVYLWTSKVSGGGNADLTIAEAAIDEVLSIPQYKLLNQYAQVFDAEGNEEIIFSVYYSILENSNQYGVLFGQSRSLVPTQLQNNPIPIGTNHAMQFSDLFYEKYRNRVPNDQRAAYISNDIQVGATNFRWTNKYKGEMNGNIRAFTSDTRIYRFAEALLFKAEILAEHGNVPDAVALLNKVVERAYGVPSYYSKTISLPELKSNLLDERMIEFAGECKSWFDLIRFGEVFKRVPSLVGRANEKEGNILYFPVHTSSFSVNPNIEQTPGFN